MLRYPLVLLLALYLVIGGVICINLAFRLMTFNSDFFVLVGATMIVLVGALEGFSFRLLYKLVTKKGKSQ